MGKKKHKKNRKDKNQRGSIESSFFINSNRYPVLGFPHFWGLPNHTSTPPLDIVRRYQSENEPLTDKDVDDAAQAADQIVRKHKK